MKKILYSSLAAGAVLLAGAGLSTADEKKAETPKKGDKSAKVETKQTKQESETTTRSRRLRSGRLLGDRGERGGRFAGAFSNLRGRFGR